MSATFSGKLALVGSYVAAEMAKWVQVARIISGPASTSTLRTQLRLHQARNVSRGIPPSQFSVAAHLA